LRIAVLSDVHSNLHALEAVLTEVDASEVDEIWCLGDIVGYGPRPNECTALLQERTSICLAGNHDLVVLGKIPIAAFAGEAAAAASWTRGVLDEAARAFLDSRRPSAVAPGAQLFHGSPLDPIWDYVLSDETAHWSFAATSEPLVLVGHSHIALYFEPEVHGELAAAETVVELGAGRHLLNPGSVGQPRNGDPRAAWLEIDNSAGRATFRRTGYPVERTQAEMRERGLPELLAERLAHGV
jgi:diadenosine tetraphosphatase ApaH/serine/threonine PP2A family protein phosphatase